MARAGLMTRVGSGRANSGLCEAGPIGAGRCATTIIRAKAVRAAMATKPSITPCVEAAPRTIPPSRVAARAGAPAGSAPPGR